MQFYDLLKHIYRRINFMHRIRHKYIYNYIKHALYVVVVKCLCYKWSMYKNTQRLMYVCRPLHTCRWANFPQYEMANQPIFFTTHKTPIFCVKPSTSKTQFNIDGGLVGGSWWWCGVCSVGWRHSFFTMRFLSETQTLRLNKHEHTLEDIYQQKKST